MSGAPLSVYRIRPAFYLFLGAAAAYGAYVIYRNTQGQHVEGGLRRSHSVRRPRRGQLQQSAATLGEFDFFGHTIVLDPHQVVDPVDLRAIARSVEPPPPPEAIEGRLFELYSTLFDRLLQQYFPLRAIGLHEAEDLTLWLSSHISEPLSQNLVNLIVLALLRHLTPRSVGDADTPDTDSNEDGPSLTLRRTLYHIAEDNERQQSVEHRGVVCSSCYTQPIRGVRWRCANCDDYDLCSECEASNAHIKTHIFYKIQVPAPNFGLLKQEPIYPGRPLEKIDAATPSLRTRLASETGLELAKISALWEQFTCLASEEWASDPNHIGCALNRQNFNKAVVPQYSAFAAAPNLIYDRLFAHYDTDHNNLIGFEEFVKGIAGLLSSSVEVKLRIAFNGYDIDGDGYISRKDVLRIFRAHYAIEKEATGNCLAESSRELSVRGALETMYSSQPLGSAFHLDTPIRGSFTEGPLFEKRRNGPGNKPTILHDDIPDTIDRAEAIRQTHMPGETSEEALMERWARRHFYIDEEEGLTRPEGVEEAFVDFENRSNASTLSRPIGERQGGYEIPEPEKDLGKEVIYQITQEAFNGMLNPIFLEKEENAMDAFATRAERGELTTQLTTLQDDTLEAHLLDHMMHHLSVFTYATRVIAHIHSEAGERIEQLFHGLKNSRITQSEAEATLEKIFNSAEASGVQVSGVQVRHPLLSAPVDRLNAKLCRKQLCWDWTTTVIALAKSVGWLGSVPFSQMVGQTPDEKAQTYEDPTLPQFRPDHCPTELLHGSGTRSGHDSPSTPDGVTYKETVPRVCVIIPGPVGPAHPTNYTSIAELDVDEQFVLRMGLNESRMSLDTVGIPVTDFNDIRDERYRYSHNNFVRHSRRIAMDPHSPLHMLLLESLNCVDVELAERKLEGVVNYEEFVEQMRDGSMRFVEAWVDRVSF